MTTELRDRLQASLGNAYTLERELGGGGMSRVFVAEEMALGRSVVVKVLPPEMAAGVSIDRFKREIQVAARLQHPHIVPVLSAGETDGLPFYTMPLVEGASLRARLARGGVTIGETVGILREVARALAYAHDHGVVHRDIKPDNVLLSGGSAVVTDFGIAKALSAAKIAAPGATLTQLGTSIGTPQYMAPEQAAGDPATNHRADLYAFGVMAYEMLAGRPPFHGLAPHKLMAAHMGERPQPILELRPDTPPLLADLVTRLLEKDPDARPQNASDIARVLEAVTSGSGGAQSAMPEVLLAGRGMLRKALAFYAAAFVLVAVVAKAAIVGIGLPSWVFPGAVVVMALGLPMILFTAYVHRATHRALTSTPTLTPGGTPSLARGTMATIAMKASPHVSWRRTTMGGLVAVGGFVALTAAWMIMRAMGIGPAGSLMAAGQMGQRERVILTEFASPASDSMLGPTVTEAFRTNLAESENLHVMPASDVREVLRRMQRPSSTKVDFAVAREIATREGIKAVIDGTVTELGGSYVLSARLVSAQTGEEMATFRETAAEAKDIIPAIDKLSRKLRSKVGESLRTIQNARTLDKVSTPSLAALQKYVAGNRALEIDGDFPKGAALLEEAIALDSGFAMAYRKLAVELRNRDMSRARSQAAIQKAYEHRDRLSDAERYLTVAAYHQYGPAPDRAKIISAYESLLDLQPDNVTALNNLALQYRYRRDYTKAEELAKRAIAVQSTAGVFYNNAAFSQMAQGKIREAQQTADLAARNLPRNPASAVLRAATATARGQVDSAVVILDSLRQARSSDLDTQAESNWRLGLIATMRGQLANGLRLSRRSNDAALQMGTANAALMSLIDEVEVSAWFRGDKPGAEHALEQALVAQPLDSLPALDRPYERLIWVASLAGRPDRAKAMLAGFDKSRAEARILEDVEARHRMLGHIAIAEKRYDDAVREYRAADVGVCEPCALPNIARAYDLAGNADSAAAVFERYVQAPEGGGRIEVDALALAGAHKRLGELYEAKGERQKAASEYAKFVELWKNADPELQPHVREVKEKLARLQRTERQ
jgi:tetratricopeptide (TPR) repeat protein/tRNA A-37 threonylcarbamoyl transferase component Bud32